jgi:TPR repeat protein
LAVLLTAAQQRQQQLQQEQQQQQNSSSKPSRREKDKEEVDAIVRIYDLLCCAVKGGVVPAIHNLGNLLAEGRSLRVPRDDEAALELYSAGMRQCWLEK